MTEVRDITFTLQNVLQFGFGKVLLNFENKGYFQYVMHGRDFRLILSKYFSATIF